MISIDILHPNGSSWEERVHENLANRAITPVVIMHIRHFKQAILDDATYKREITRDHAIAILTLLEYEREAETRFERQQCKCNH